MKRILLLLSFAFIGLAAFSQSQYEVTMDGPDKILKGIISRDLVQKDTSFKWFALNQKSYVPYTDAVSAIKPKASTLHFIVFGGTWCHDTQFILPKFFSLADAAAVPAGNISLIGVDRNKKTLGNLSESMGVTNVPTIIVMKDGKEIGRVVEYGKTGLWDKELGEIIGANK
jgi:thiol-disulfide isomerase/thioredoxin